jgi:catechol 2,3-dioxygenase-like lactoylglutathione lyase family enzyme
MADSGELFFGFRVTDVERSAEFYRTLGFEPVEEDTWNSDYATLLYGGTRISLMTFIPQQVLMNFEHGNQASVESMGNRLRGRDLAPIAAGKDGAGLYVEDPDGNGVYIFTDASD